MSATLRVLLRTVEALGAATPQEIEDFRREFVPKRKETERANDMAKNLAFVQLLNDYEAAHPGFSADTDGRVWDDE